MYRFLLRPKWLLFLVGCIAFSALFVRLGFWQLDRLEQRRASNQRVTDARHREPVDVTSLAGVNRPPAERDDFRRVTATGTYEDDVLVRGRTVDRQAGFYVVAPLTLRGGERLLVVRGWAPFSEKGADVAPDIPHAPSGEVTVVGRVRLPEGHLGGATPVGPYRSFRRIAPTDLGGDRTLAAYVELVEQKPAAGRGLVAIPEPELGEGPHLSYAVQWFLFATLTFVGYGVYARREAEYRRAPAEAPTSPAVAPSR